MVRLLAARAQCPGFDSPIAQHVQRLITRAFTYAAVGSLVFKRLCVVYVSASLYKLAKLHYITLHFILSWSLA